MSIYWDRSDFISILVAKKVCESANRSITTKLTNTTSSVHKVHALTVICIITRQSIWVPNFCWYLRWGLTTLLFMGWMNCIQRVWLYWFCVWTAGCPHTCVLPVLQGALSPRGRCPEKVTCVTSMPRQLRRIVLLSPPSLSHHWLAEEDFDGTATGGKDGSPGSPGSPAGSPPGESCPPPGISTLDYYVLGKWLLLC